MFGALAAILGLTGIAAAGRYVINKKDEASQPYVPPPHLPGQVRANAAIATGALSPIAVQQTAAQVSASKLDTLKAVVAKLITMAPVTPAERANAINTAIAAGLPALATAIQGGNILAIASAAVGLK